MWYWTGFSANGGDRAVIGTASFKGHPTENGVVEIAYGLTLIRRLSLGPNHDILPSFPRWTT